MDHLATPLEELRSRLFVWLPDERSRLLRVDLDAELRDGARSLVAALEWAPDNHWPFFELEGPASWDARSAELRAAYDARAAAFREQGLELPSLPAPPIGVGPRGAFVACLARVARVFDDRSLGTRGVIVVVRDGGPDLAELAAAPGLERARWIWLQPTVADRGGAGAAADANVDVGAGAGVPTILACRIDRAAQKREIDELLAAMIAGVDGGARGAPGAARPRRAPPPHPSDVPVGDRPGAGGVPHLRALLLAVQAARAQGPAAALPLLRQARDGAAAAGLAVDAAEMELLLGGFAAASAREQGAPIAQVAPVFESAAARAEAAGAPATGAKARFFLGVAAASSGELAVAGPALLAAAEQARVADDAVLTFHALRLAGELATGAGLRARGLELWSEAVRVADGMGTAEAAAAGLAGPVEALRIAVGRAGTHAFELTERRWSARPGAPALRAASSPR